MTRLSFIRNPFKASFRLLIMAFAVMQLFSSCKRKKICPAFSYSNYDAWFPYTEGQKLMFMNARQDKDSIIIFQNSRSAATEEEWGWGASEPRCRAESEIKGGEGGVFLHISCSLSENSKSITVTVSGLSVWAGSVGDTGLAVDSNLINAGLKSTYHSSLLLNGKTYTSVQLLEINTPGVSYEGMQRVYLSKENGIIAYEKYPSHELWIKQ